MLELSASGKELLVRDHDLSGWQLCLLFFDWLLLILVLMAIWWFLDHLFPVLPLPVEALVRVVIVVFLIWLKAWLSEHSWCRLFFFLVIHDHALIGWAVPFVLSFGWVETTQARCTSVSHGDIGKGSLTSSLPVTALIVGWWGVWVTWVRSRNLFTFCKLLFFEWSQLYFHFIEIFCHPCLVVFEIVDDALTVFYSLILSLSILK